MPTNPRPLKLNAVLTIVTQTYAKRAMKISTKDSNIHYILPNLLKIGNTLRIFFPPLVHSILNKSIVLLPHTELIFVKIDTRFDNDVVIIRRICTPNNDDKTPDRFNYKLIV